AFRTPGIFEVRIDEFPVVLVERAEVDRFRPGQVAIARGLDLADQRQLSGSEDADEFAITPGEPKARRGLEGVEHGNRYLRRRIVGLREDCDLLVEGLPLVSSRAGRIRATLGHEVSPGC